MLPLPARLEFSVESVFVCCSVDVGSMPIRNCLDAEVGWPGAGDPVSLFTRCSCLRLYTLYTATVCSDCTYLRVLKHRIVNLFLGSIFSCTFRSFFRKLAVWTIPTTVNSHRDCAVICTDLSGIGTIIIVLQTVLYFLGIYLIPLSKS